MRDYLLLHINGEPKRITGAAAFETLSRFLRYRQGATGTKIVCEEGDCGACTVLVGRVEDGRLRYRPVNSCIQFLFQLDCTSIITVEGLSKGGSLTPVQEAMVQCHGAQCGYCTPGFVMALAGMFETGTRDARKALTGNLCRCTGYESILRAAACVDRQPQADELYPPRPILDAIASLAREPVRIENFYKPATLAEAIRFKAEHPKTVIVQGATDFGVWRNKRGFEAPALLSLDGLDGLGDVALDGETFVIGGRVTLAQFEASIVTLVPELAPILDRFGSPQIKNTGTLAGNIANASPIADTLPFLYVMEAQIELTGARGTRTVPIAAFYKGYKSLDLAADEIITRIRIPLPRREQTLRLYKISKRSHLDISSFTAAMLMTRTEGRIDAIRIAYGGVAPTVVRLTKSEAFLAGRPFTLESFIEAGEHARNEIAPITDVRGTKEYRLQLAQNAMVKFFHDALAQSSSPLRSAEELRGTPRNPEEPVGTAAGWVGRDVPHDSARGHVSGESLYIDDLPPLHNELVVDFVWSPYAHARIKSIELPEPVDGVVGLYTHRHLVHNALGPIIADEPLLASDTVTFRGQPIVVIAAESHDAVRAAKKAIRIDYEELKPIFTIEEAIAARQFIGETRVIRRGDVDAALAGAEHVLEGVFENQGQDHFYLESQAALVIPGEHGALTVHSSTQHPTEVQEVIAHLLGLDMSRIVVNTKRMGGAFGGKESQATHPAAMAALVASRTKRPARIVYDKDSDMHVTGKRHPFRNRYRVGFTAEGEITAMKVELYSDGGAYADLSPAVMARAMTHADNAYFIPNVEIRGTVCRTNMPPNTAFRGFGGPQGVATMENIVEEIAAVLKRDAYEIRRANCYGIESRNTTPYGEVVENNTLPHLFTELETRTNYRARRDAVRAFNASSQTHLRGLAMTAVKFGISFNTTFLNQANALVNVYLDGSVQVSTGATEMGQGVNTKIRQIVADALRVPIDRVQVMPTSTEKNNNTSATAASSGADLNGAAARDACTRIRQRLDNVAARHPGLTFEQLVKAAYHERVPLGERGFYATPRIDWDWSNGGQGRPFLYFTMATACSEVLIDRFTGEMRVLRSDVLMDVGKPLNPGVDRGQLVGGFIQGLGWVTTEDLRYAPNGELLSHSPTTYKIPNVNDLPEEFHLDWIDRENPVNIGGSKAVGEPPLLTAISVWCAVKDALRVVSNGDIPKLRLPATSEEILMRLTEQTKRGDAHASEVPVA